LERTHRVERLRRGDQRGATAGLEREAEISGTPEIAVRLIAAALFDRIEDVVDPLLFQRKRRGPGGGPQAKRRQPGALVRHLDAVANGFQLVRRPERLAYRASCARKFTDGRNASPTRSPPEMSS